MLHSEVSRLKTANTNPYPDGNFFVDLNGPGILRDELSLATIPLCFEFFRFRVDVLQS